MRSRMLFTFFSDEGTGPYIEFQKERSHDANIYNGINCKLRTKVSPHDMKRVLTCYQHTFWAIPGAFVACQADFALAKRGLNIDRMFFYSGLQAELELLQGIQL